MKPGKKNQKYQKQNQIEIDPNSSLFANFNPPGQMATLPMYP